MDFSYKHNNELDVIPYNLRPEDNPKYIEHSMQSFNKVVIPELQIEKIKSLIKKATYKFLDNYIFQEDVMANISDEKDYFRDDYVLDYFGDYLRIKNKKYEEPLANFEVMQYLYESAIYPLVMTFFTLTGINYLWLIGNDAVHRAVFDKTFESICSLVYDFYQQEDLLHANLDKYAIQFTKEIDNIHYLNIEYIDTLIDDPKTVNRVFNDFFQNIKETAHQIINSFELDKLDEEDSVRLYLLLGKSQNIEQSIDEFTRVYQNLVFPAREDIEFKQTNSRTTPLHENNMTIPKSSVKFKKIVAEDKTIHDAIANSYV